MGVLSQEEVILNISHSIRNFYARIFVLMESCTSTPMLIAFVKHVTYIMHPFYEKKLQIKPGCLVLLTVVNSSVNFLSTANENISISV